MKDEECNDDERIGKPVSENLVIIPKVRFEIYLILAVVT